MKYDTLVGALEGQRRTARAIHYLESEVDARVVPFRELYDRATVILYHLQQRGMRRGDKLILLLSDNEQFLDGFWAALAGGIIPVPLAPGNCDEHRRKLFRVARQLGTPYLYTSRKHLERLRAFASATEDAATLTALCGRLVLVDEIEDIGRTGRVSRPEPDDVAFIQYSSGSTSDPKGVVLTHRNIITNCRAVGELSRFTAEDVSLSWMPLTHDMGLIGFHLFMFCHGIEIYHMPTDLFVRRPLLWTTFASRHRATITSSPNFGYRHYLRALGDRSLEGVDLSSLRLIYNGAEPICASLCDEFLTRLAPYGLRDTALFTVYGLAEATLAQTFPPAGRKYTALSFDRHSLGIGATARVVGDPGTDGVTLVSVGRPVSGAAVRIASPDGAAVADGRVGHVLIRGDNVTRGYFEAPEANAAAFTTDGWLDTGDLGLRLNGEIYITGRAKELIFINGQNYYPHDLEEIAATAAGVEAGKVVAVGARWPDSEDDELTLFIVHRDSIASFIPVTDEVIARVNRQAGVEVRHVVPVKRIPKTTSGKPQRVALERAFVAGTFAAEMDELALLRRTTTTRRVETGSGTIAARLLAICESVAADRRIEADDNLFEIGVNSLTLIQIHEQIDREYPGLVELTELFDHPTITSLATHLEAALRATSAPADVRTARHGLGSSPSPRARSGRGAAAERDARSVTSHAPVMEGDAAERHG